MHLHSIDFHYHAGQERAADVTLHDHLTHARVTGRRVLGLTDHLQFYLSDQPVSPERAARFPYERSLDGLARYRGEMEELRDAFPELEMFFGPEVPPKIKLADIPDRVLELSDYFIVECHFHPTIEEHTAEVVGRLEEMGAFTAATGKPTFLAHPFRLAVNHRLVKRDIEPWITQIPPRSDRDYPATQVNELYVLDVEAVGEASQRTGVPLEINGGTQNRVRCSNLAAAIQMLWRAYELMAQRGAAFVPGSDQHGYRQSVGRMGGYVPYDCFEAIGVGLEDIGFLEAVRRSRVTLV